MNGHGSSQRPAGGALSTCYLAKVVAVDDPDGLSRVQIRLLSFDGIDDQDAPIWARVSMPSAGDARGGFFLPDVGDEVVVTFVNGDSRFPIILGGLYSGAAEAPESLPGDRVDRWTITGKNGSRIAIVEEESGQPTIELSTPNGNVSGTFTDEGGGTIELATPTTTVKIDSSGCSVKTSGKASVKGSNVDVTAPTVKVNAAVTEFTGLVKCLAVKTTLVASDVYTPGAGNIW